MRLDLGAQQLQLRVLQFRVEPRAIDLCAHPRVIRAAREAVIGTDTATSMVKASPSRK